MSCPLTHWPEQLFLVSFMLPWGWTSLFVSCYRDPVGVMREMSRDCVKFKHGCVCEILYMCV